MKEYPSQILGLTQEIKFSATAISAISMQKLEQFRGKITKELGGLTRQKESADLLTQLKLKSLILDKIHHLGVVEKLITDNVEDLNNWNWYKQLKFHYNNKTKLVEI